jgi:glycosyltransferase involved in cell wall biosynthesis
MIRRVILLSHGFQAEYECAYANALARVGVAVTLIGSDSTLVERLEPTVEVLNYRGSRDPRRPRWAKAANLLRYTLRYLSFLARHRGEPVHMIGMFTAQNPFIALLEAWCTRWLAGRYVLTVHNLLPHDNHSRLGAWLARGIYRSAAACMVHTERMRVELNARFGVPLQRITVVQHGIDRVMLDAGQPRSALRSRFGLPPDVPVVLSFGIVARYKGLDVLLPAMDLVRQRTPAVLVVAGLCRDPDLKRWLQDALAAGLADGTAVWLDGYVPEDDVPSLFHSADVVVLPYRHIDQSGVVFMAMATGVPVVASDVGSLADYVQPPGAVVRPGEVGELADAIVKVLAAPRLTRTRATAHAEAFLWSRTVLPIMDAYRGLWPSWMGPVQLATPTPSMPQGVPQ